MRRVSHLHEKLISDSNLEEAITTVCKSHRWIIFPKKQNPTVLWLESDLKKRIEDLRRIIEDGYVPSPVMRKKRYDVNAGKWRDIAEPKIWPDQCIHHALIQVLEPVMMRGMDNWCCGSIKGRGAHYGIRAIKKWIKKGKGVKWCIEMDIRHFYDSIKPEEIISRMKRLIKDRRVLDLIERVVADGIQIGAYCSQWFANTLLQPLDQLIRNSGATRYIRYMDNFTVFTNRKKTADKIIKAVRQWLLVHGLKLKDNWQKFKIRARLPNALGYRFGKGYTLMRKKNLLRFKRLLRKFYRMRESGKFIPVKFAQGLLSRLGMLRHCNSYNFYKLYVRPHTQKQLKGIVKNYYRKEMERCSIYLAQPTGTAA